MGDKSPIQWTEATWNPTVGCTRVTAGCDHCYAFQLHDQRHVAWKRGRFPTAPVQYHLPFSRVQTMEDRVDLPLHWRKPRRIFVDSMSDLFHEGVPDAFVNRVWKTMRNARWHTYQILTKRPERLLEWTRTAAAAKGWPVEEIWPEWVWLGVSVEDQAAADGRIPALLRVPARVRFLSCEPLLGPVSLSGHLEKRPPRRCGVCADCCDRLPVRCAAWDAPGLDWVIVGGESGPHARPMALHWARSLVDQCRQWGVTPFVKQLGSVWARGERGRQSHGGEMSEWPDDLRVREWPGHARAEVPA